MICPGCGMDIPEESTVCPTCGYQVSAADSAQQYDGDAQYSDPYQAAPVYTPAPAKKKTGLVVGIIAGVVVVAAVAVCLVLFVFGNKTDGKYVCDTFAAFGMDFYLDVKGEAVSMVMAYDTDGDGTISEEEMESEDGTIEFDGDVCTITIEGESVDCTYDKKEGTIVMSDDDFGVELTFTKEK
jgi:hypothetical protein